MWLVNGDIYAVADSAVTWQQKPATVNSSFGDAVVQRGPEIVEEAVCKIFQLGPNSLGMIAGNGDIGQQAMQALRGRLDGEDLLVQVQGIIGGPGGVSGCELLVGRVLAGRPEIVLFDGKLFRSTSGGAIIGSLPPERMQELDGFMTQLRYLRSTPQQRLVTTIAFLRALGVQNPLIENGVGGAMYGALIRRNGVEWQLDTNFILFDPRLTKAVNSARKGPPSPLLTIDEHFDEIRVAVREAVVVVYSTLTGKDLLANDLVLPCIEDWKSRWLPDVFRSFAEHGAQFVVFISCVSPHVIVVDRCASKDTFIRPHGDGRLRMPWAISPDLMNELISPSKSIGPGRVFIFNRVEKYPTQDNPRIFLFARVHPVPTGLANIELEHINPVSSWLEAQQQILAIFPNVNFTSSDGMLKCGTDRWDFEPFLPYGCTEESGVILSMNHWRLEEGIGDWTPVLRLACATGWTALDSIDGQIFTPQGLITSRG